MNKDKKIDLDPFGRKRAYLWTAAIIVLCYIFFSPLMNVNDGADIRVLMLIGIFMISAVAALGFYNKMIDYRQIIALIIIGGIIMRVGYMLYTSDVARGHDVGTLASNGHLGYIYYIYQNFSLPPTNGYQFYHPPLFHILAAVVAKIASIFSPGTAADQLLQVTKIVPCFASCALLIVSDRLCAELKISKTATIAALSIIAFHPTFYILSASINNDALMILFFMLAFLYTIRWYYNQTMKNIIAVALPIGLGMMTKLSAGTIALLTGPIFVAVLIRSIGTQRIKKLIGQFAAFAAVCLPLGLWYPIRNLIMFKQPLGYVLKISEQSDLYCGYSSFASRFLTFPVTQLLNPIYCNVTEDVNIWMYTVKCSLFGEFKFGDGHELPARILIVANLLLILLSLVSMIYVMVRCKDANPFARFGLFGLWVILMASFLQFNILYPFGCTMDFRYIVPTVIIGAIYIGMALSDIRRRSKREYAIVAPIFIGIIVAFVAASVAFYTM